MAKSEKLEFQTEVSQLLKLMINSVYSEKEVLFASSSLMHLMPVISSGIYLIQKKNYLRMILISQ